LGQADDFSGAKPGGHCVVRVAGPESGHPIESGDDLRLALLDELAAASPNETCWTAGMSPYRRWNTEPIVGFHPDSRIGAR
jgi:hypothetical protein